MHSEAGMKVGDKEEQGGSSWEPGLLQGQSHGLEVGSS